MNKGIFTGAGTALVTPMKNGKVDYDALEKLIEFQIENSIDALIVTATTGEAPTLEDDEHIDVVKFCVEKVNKRVPVIAGTGSNNTEHAVMMSKKAEEVGADGLLWVSPYYNKATQEGLYQHYKTLAESTNLPAILYNVPGRTGLNILPETVERLAEIDNIVAIKEADGNVKQAMDIIRRCGDKIDVLSGDDDLVVPMMAMGGKGVISVLSNVAPKETHEMCQLCFDGEFDKAAKLQLKYIKLIDALFSEVNPIPVKTALNAMGMIEDEFRLPLCKMGEKAKANLLVKMKEVGIKIKD